MAEKHGPIELRIELPKGELLSEAQVKAALEKAVEDPRLVKLVKDFLVTSQTESAVAKLVVEGETPPQK